MKSKMNIEELNKNKEKARIYKTDEELTFNSIKEVLENINYNYDTNNTSKLEELETELINKLNIISTNHTNNITVIEKNIEYYKSKNKDTEKIFNKLIDG